MPKKKKYGMVINLDKCLGCKTCTIACNTENSVLTTKTWNVVLDTVKNDYPNYKRKFIPRPCMHCNIRPCLDVVPPALPTKMKKPVSFLLTIKSVLGAAVACLNVLMKRVFLIGKNQKK